MLKSITQVNQNDKQISKTVKRFFIMQEISHSDVSGITTKAPCEAALMGECHMRIEISAFVMRTFVLVKLVLCHRVESETIDRKQNR